MMAAQGHAESGQCSIPGCGCASFTSQLYRPALCLTCFHNIGTHFPGEWAEIEDATDKRVYFVHGSSGEKLYARPADASSALSSQRRSTVARPRTHTQDAKEDAEGGGEAASGPHVPDALAKWTAFSQAASASVPVGAPGPKAAPTRSGPSGSARVGAPMGAATGESVGAAGTGGLAEGAQAMPAVPLSPREIAAVPDAPTGVSNEVLSALALDINALAHSMSATGPRTGAPSVMPLQANMHVAPMVSPLAAAASNAATSSVTVPVSAPAGMSRSGPSTEAVGFTPSVAAQPAPPGILTVDTLTTILPTDASADFTGGTITPAVSPPAAAPAASTPAAAHPAALATFLEPIYADPLLVPLGELMASGPASGVSVFPVRQPYEERIEMHRYLVITPFTIMALAAHPTRLGVGILKWERSILSLRNVSMQPIFHAAQARGNSRYSLMPEGASVASHAGGSARGQVGSGSGSLFSGLFRRGKSFADESAPAAPPEASVGVLAIFAPETRDTAALLRTYRAGRRPVLREGWLMKKKQGSWRERAPLGSLAWKRRYFLLSATELTYLSGIPGDKGAVVKGVIPLNGWVEVVRLVGDAAGGTAGKPVSPSGDRVSPFVIRTGKTFHLFQAASQKEADEWIEAISINAQHLGASSHEPQMVLANTEADAVKIATALRDKYVVLTDAMEPAAREAARSLLSIDTEVQDHSPPAEDLDADYGVDSDDDAEMHAAKMASLGMTSARPTVAVDLDEQDEYGMSVRSVLQLAEADGGVTDELLAQVSPQLAHRVRQYQAMGGNVHGMDQRHEEVELSEVAAAGKDAAVAVMSPTGALILTPTAAPLSPHAYNHNLGWVYLDDYDRPQGPFVEAAMRAWLLAGYLKQHTLVRFASPAPSLDVTCGVDAEGIPQVFLPLFSLFPDPATAFCGDMQWVPRYESATRYQALVTTAVQLGLDRALVVQQVHAMRVADMPPDLSLLMDLCGIHELPEAAVPASA